ncbi:carcinine transporter [Phlebotomus argentipes]|uniref:carcinine transporter n=1 Tax=Phlebotomus argentipes TaxID=94469 RepID=UPI0028934A17|nr:carcinine transporter [Phlebotomus argentipes]
MEGFPYDGTVSSPIPFCVEELDEEECQDEAPEGEPLNAKSDNFSVKSQNDANAENESFDLDELLPSISEFGKYQKLLVFLICLPACVPCGFGAFNQLFMSDNPSDYWCAVPQLMNNSDISAVDRRYLTIPTNADGSYSKCLRYAVNWSEVLDKHDGNLQDLRSQNNSWPVEMCYDGWEFNTTDARSSIVIDFSLVCNRDIYPTLGLSALNIGGPIGVYLFGLLNDRVGRRISYFFCLATLLLGSFLTAVSPNFWTWAASRIIVGLTIPAVYQIPFILALELVGPAYRSFVTVMTCTFYTFSLMTLAGITAIIDDWRALSLYTSVPFLLYFLYAFVMPESPRWLLAQNRLEEALKVLEVMARVNGKEFPHWFRDKLQHRVASRKLRGNVKEPNRRVGALDLCRTPNMRLKTILITLNWFANETVYLGLSYYGPELGDNAHLSFFFTSLVEIPSYILCWMIMDRWGRRWPLCLLMILSGISCIVTVMLPEEAKLDTLVLFLLSKSMISASFLIIYPFAGELYPTQVRGVGIGTSSYIGGLGLIGIPFINYLGKDNLRLPLVIMGAVSVVGGITGLRLPETLHHCLPQTIEEGEKFGKDWNWHECFRCIPIRPAVASIGSYENLSKKDKHNDRVELKVSKGKYSENSPLERRRVQRNSMKRLVRQSSTMDTQKTHDGAMQLTYWF